jgi:hypothetical protein
MDSRLSCYQFGGVRHLLPKVNAVGHKAYRRKGYRVRIEAWHGDQLRWAVYRPRMKTSVATGIERSVESAVAVANAWIANDAHGLRVT